jgi:integrase
VGCIYRMNRSPFYWLKWVGLDGQPQYESSRSADYNTAKTMLAEREGKLAAGVPVTSAIGRLKFRDAAADLETDFRVNGRKSLDEVERRLRLHLLPYFGRLRMVEIDTAVVRRYVAKRQTDTIVIHKARTIHHRDGRREVLPEQTKPVSNAEINRELQILKRCFNLAIEDGRLLHCPHIPMLTEHNVRKGFLDAAQLHSVLAFLPAELQPVIWFAFLTGWRLASEVLPLTWSRVDFGAGEVRLDAGTTKNGEGRVFPMNEELRALLLERRRVTDALQRKHGIVISTVFHREAYVKQSDGTWKLQPAQPIKSISKAWRNACAQAGLPGRILHDLRRSSIRNMVRAGISETVAMKLSGHKTRSVFDRYNITSSRDLQDAADRLTGLVGSPEVRPKVRLAAVIGGRGGAIRRNAK